MNTNLHIDMLMDDLLKNKITRTEAEKALRKEGITDTAQEIDLYFAAIKSIERFDVLTQIKSIHSQYHGFEFSNNPPLKNINNTAQINTRLPHKWMLRIAASVLLIAGGWLGYQFATTNTAKLYSQIYQPYYLNTDRGIGNIKTHNMIQEFKSRDYPAVIKTYTSLTITNTREKFLTAYAYHASGNYHNAISLLQQVLDYNHENNTKLYNDEAEFYLALSYLKTGDIALAIPLFAAISKNNNHTFHDKVSKWTIRKLKWLQ